MVTKIVNNLVRSKSYSGIVCTVKDDASISYSLLEASVKDNKVTVERECKIVTEAELAGIRWRSIPGIVVIGDGVLFKKVSNVQSKQLHEMTKSAFPFLKVEDFFVQSYRTDSDIFISVVKKELVMKIIDSLGRSDIFPVAITVGPFVLSQLIPLLENIAEPVQISGYEVKCSAREISHVEQNEASDRFTLKSDEIATKMPLCLAVILFIISPGPIECSDSNLIDSLRVNFRYKTYYFSLRTWAAAALFIILTINVILFQRYSALNESLREKHSAAVLLKDKLAAIKATYQAKKSFADSLHLSDPQRMAFFGDRLAKSLPSSIRWETLNVYPVVKKFNAELLAFDKSRIQVRGTCRDPLILQKWITEIQAYKWIAGVEGQRYFYNDDKNTGEFEFTIELGTNDTHGL